MKAILIKPGQAPQEVETTGEWHDIRTLIECEWITTVRVDDEHVMYVDDEGLLNGAGERIGFIFPKWYPQALAGNGLILGVDLSDGESKGCTLTLEEVAAKFA